MSKVYLINNNFRNDYTSIPDTLGNRVVITEGIVKETPEQLIEIFDRAFENSTPNDYLVMSGPALVTAIAFHRWMVKHGSCQAFVWDRNRGYLLSQIGS